MDMKRWEKPPREDRYRHARTNPSFSSTLLDAIYRSIDEGDEAGEEEELVFYRETMRKKQSSNVLIEQWMEKKVSEKVIVRRKSSSAQDFDFNPPNRNSVVLNSTSSSSDSSSGGGFSSSEAESVHGGRTSKSSGLKPVRTVIPDPKEKPPRNEKQQSKIEGGFIKTKSRALKIYGDLKKAKQPISPGGRLSSFLNSLFNSGYQKKAKISSSSSSSVGTRGDGESKSKSAQASTCSSASSFSRSCLSKTPSSRGKLSNGMKRSVRFYPFSVIVDEDCRPCGHKCLHEDDPNLIRKIREVAPSMINEELQFHLMEKNRRVEEAARDLLKGYQKKCYFDDDDEDDDVASYSSSDLFELDNLAVIEELPVYETTHLDTNRAIANGLIL